MTYQPDLFIGSKTQTENEVVEKKPVQLDIVTFLEKNILAAKEADCLLSLLNG